MKKVLSFLGGLSKKRLAETFTLFVCLGFISFSSAQAKTPIMLGLGDSIGEGVQSADANLRTQPFNYLDLLAKQIGVCFHLPLIKSGPLGVVEDTTNRSRLLPFVAASNLSVSGADVNSLLNDKADALSVDEIDSETDLVLFPRIGSQVEIAESLGLLFLPTSRMSRTLVFLLIVRISSDFSALILA